MDKKTKLFGGLMTAALFLSGCGDAPDKAAAAEPDTFPTSIDLREGFDPNASFEYAYYTTLSSWDPAASTVGIDLLFMSPVYDRLFELGPDGEVNPMLATEYEAADDGKSMTLKLREGLTFSDGTPFNAEVVKFNLDRNRAPESKIAGEVYQITSVDVVDDLTIKINVSGSLGPLPVALAARPGVMVSPVAVESGTLQTHPVGIGPFVTSEIEPGNKITFVKSENYWDPDVQRVAEMTFLTITDDQSRYNALINGEVDAAYLPGENFDQAAEAAIEVLARPAINFTYLAVNTSIEPFDDPEVRKALNMAIDREGIAEGLFDGYCTPQVQPFPEGSVGYSEKVGDGLDQFPYDPEAAQKIFEEKGLTSMPLVNSVSNITSWVKLAEVLQSNLEAVGVESSVDAVPPAQMIQKFALDEQVELMTAGYTGQADPDYVYSRYLSNTALFNPGQALDPELDQLAVQAASSVDPADRTPLYEEYMDAWVENPPHIIPICMLHLGTGYNANVSGVTQLNNGSPDLRGVAIDA